MNSVDEVRALLSQHADVPEDPSGRLELDSFTLVIVAEAIEEKFGFRIRPADVVPENFGSLERLAAFVDGKRA